MDDTEKKTTETRNPNMSTENQREGDARMPAEQLDKDRMSEETIPRKSSLLGNE